MNFEEIVLDINNDELMNLVGPYSNNIKVLEKLYNKPIFIRDNIINIDTDDKDVYIKFIDHLDTLIKLIKSNETINEDIIMLSFNGLKDNKKSYDELNNRIIMTAYNNTPIKAKTLGQNKLINAIEENTITIAQGPAGSGKTYLAVVMAIKALKEDSFKKIVLTRPVVEAGESLGFLPGDLKEKVDPYLMPLYDALDELLGHEKVEALIDRKVIEIIPLAYMRGRSLNNSFIILDEAQNTTSMQMLMFLTRLGKDSKMVITGDLSQTDRISYKNDYSGLKDAISRLKNTDNIAIINMKESDIVRNPLVKVIIDKYND